MRQCDTIGCVEVFAARNNLKVIVIVCLFVSHDTFGCRELSAITHSVVAKHSLPEIGRVVM